MKGYAVEGETIILNRELTELDFFVKDFLSVLEKHSDYLIVSGFVSISTGRSRATEDVDILVPRLDKNEFKKLFSELIDSGFWCYQGESVDEAFQYVSSKERIRFARSGTVFPNMEFITFDNSEELKQFEFSHPQKLAIGDFTFKAPPIEFEILYKELILGSQKDIEDALHLREFFSAILRGERFKEYGALISKYEGLDKP